MASTSPQRRMLRWSALTVKKWRYVHCRCHDFRFYVTLFPKCFSNFRSRYLFAIGLPTLYLTLADTYLPLHTAFPSSATLLMPFHEATVSGSTGYHRAWAQYSHERLCPATGLLCTLNFTSPLTIHYRRFCHSSKSFETPIRQRVRSLFGRP